ncbi:MAG: 2,3-bisphosphoglycerate-independent phosphoglycerate mutase [Butyricicoccus pullicaecorum]|nr:2,3-bisphosphoglycerate-independent phosphoglycerate mutase [Butyricicoccus pullicaecorum]
MKYIVVIADGAADLPLPNLGTPLHYAKTPCLSALASKAQLGQTCLIPNGCPPGSLPALLTLLGASQEACQGSRAALEALALGAEFDTSLTAFRCNLISLQEGCIAAHDAGGITQTEAEQLIESLSAALGDACHTFLSGTTYRALLLRKGSGPVFDSPSPETLLGQPAHSHLPKDTDLCRLFTQAQKILAAHPVNLARQADGRLPANAIWFWGGGTLPNLPTFSAQTGLRGAVIGGVPLIRGIGQAMQLSVLSVPHTDGTLYTNWEGKAFAALDALRQMDFVLIHAEAPDEAGHAGSFSQKVAAIEYLDQRLLAPLTERLHKTKTDFRMLILPDHPTPVCLRHHTADPIPFLLYDSRRPQSGGIFDEQHTKTLPMTSGTTLLNLLLERTSL